METFWIHSKQIIWSFPASASHLQIDQLYSFLLLRIANVPKEELPRSRSCTRDSTKALSSCWGDSPWNAVTLLLHFQIPPACGGSHISQCTPTQSVDLYIATSYASNLDFPFTWIVFLLLLPSTVGTSLEMKRDWKERQKPVVLPERKRAARATSLL